MNGNGGKLSPSFLLAMVGVLIAVAAPLIVIYADVHEIKAQVSALTRWHEEDVMLLHAHESEFSTYREKLAAKESIDEAVNREVTTLRGQFEKLKELVYRHQGNKHQD